MFSFINAIVSFLHAVLLSAGAILALIVLPPVGLLMLVMLREHMQRGARQMRS